MAKTKKRTKSIANFTKKQGRGGTTSQRPAAIQVATKAAEAPPKSETPIALPSLPPLVLTSTVNPIVQESEKPTVPSNSSMRPTLVDGLTVVRIAPLPPVAPLTEIPRRKHGGGLLLAAAAVGVVGLFGLAQVISVEISVRDSTPTASAAQATEGQAETLIPIELEDAPAPTASATATATATALAAFKNPVKRIPNTPAKAAVPANRVAAPATRRIVGEMIPPREQAEAVQRAIDALHREVSGEDIEVAGAAMRNGQLPPLSSSRQVDAARIAYGRVSGGRPNMADIPTLIKAIRDLITK